MIVDMSPRAITTRLRRVAQLRAAYLRLQHGKLVARDERSDNERVAWGEDAARTAPDSKAPPPNPPSS